MRLTLLLLASLFPATVALAADSALLNLVMPEARMVAGIDVERARDSFLGQKLLAEIHSKSNDDMAKFIAMTGFDPRRDLREILVAAPDAQNKKAPALIALRGTFDAQKLSAFIKSSGGAKVENFSGVDVYSKADSKEDMGFAFLDGAVAVAGNIDAVKAAIGRRGNRSAALPAATLAKVQNLSQNNDIWMLSSIPVSELQNALPVTPPAASQGMMNGEAFKGIEQAAMGVRFGGTTMDVMAETISRTEKDATAIADIVRFLSTMVQLNRDKPEVQALATALDAMKLTTEARTTRFSITVPVADLEKMMATKSKAPAKKI